MSSGFIKCWNFLDHMLHLFLPHPLPLLFSFGITCIQSVFCPCCSFLQMFNAKQVTEWCLYVIGLNFLKYESVEKEFELIVSEHSQFFEKHCWPPQDHRKVLKKYRQSAKRNRWDKRQLTQRGSSCLPLNCHVMQDVKKNWLGTVVCSFLKKPYVHSEVYSPTVFETCITNVDTECLGNYQANIWDTGGYGVFRSVRPLAYIDADVFMMCFDITNRESFENLTEVWLPEIQSFQPNTPVLFVGMKGDLRTISSNRWVTVWALFPVLLI